MLQSERVDFEFIARSCSLLLAVSESKFRELECVEEIALSLSEKSSICGRGLVEETVSLELVLYVTGADSSGTRFENLVCDLEFLLPERESDEALEFDLIVFLLSLALGFPFSRFDDRVEIFEEPD